LEAAVSIERTRDLALVREVFTRPAQWDAATDDAAPERATFTPNADERIIYLAVSAPTKCVAFRELLGIITLIPRNAVLFELHAALDLSRAKTATAAARAAIAWLFEHTPARRIIGEIPATNRLAIAIAERAGMQHCGRNPRSFLKRGALVDLVQLGISK
jgi:hypothetical protein